MTPPSTLYRFRIELSDIDRGVYDTLDFRIAQHPSETVPYLLTRVFAFALNTQPDLEFSPGGLSDPDAPGSQITSPGGGHKLWIEIGNAGARKLHKASKSSQLVKVYTYKDPEIMLREIRNESVHRAEQIEIYSLRPAFLDRLSQWLERDNRWSILHHDGELTISCGEKSEREAIPRLMI